MERIGFGELAEMIAGRAVGARVMVGIAGPPGAGKSTIAARLAAHLGERAVVVPMDGFHLASSVLAERQLSDVKGAPETFDAEGFVSLLGRVRAQTAASPIFAPAFDRALEEPVADSIEISSQHNVVIVEGNYLLLGERWAQVANVLDMAVYVELDTATRVARLIARHVAHGRSHHDAEAWVHRSDERNAELVAATRHRADYSIIVD